MKRVTLIIAVVLAVVGISTVHAGDAQQDFVASVDKALKISGQMASGKVPYNPARATKEMLKLTKAVETYQAAGLENAPKELVDCTKKLKTTSNKGVVAAKAGKGAFKAVYGDLVESYKECALKK